MAWTFKDAETEWHLTNGSFTLVIPGEEFVRLRQVQNIGQLNRFLNACAKKADAPGAAREGLRRALSEGGVDTTEHLLQILDAIP